MHLKLVQGLNSALPFIAIGSALLMMLNAFRLLYLGEPISFYLSNVLLDRPSPEVQPESDIENYAIGSHYFGDFLQPYLFSRWANPWLHYPLAPMYPPVAIFVLAALQLLPYESAFVLYFSLMLVSNLVAVWVVTPGATNEMRALLAIVFVLFSAPFLTALDRGNTIGFFPLLIALLWRFMVSGQRYAAAGMIAFLASIKLYPVFLVFLLLRRKWLGPSLLAVLAPLIVSVAWLVAAPGNATETLTAIFSAVSAATAYHDNGIQSIFETYWVSRGIEDPASAASLTVFSYTVLRYCLAGVAALLVLFSNKLTEVERFGLAFVVVTSVYSAASGYNWIWISVLGPLLWWGIRKSEGKVSLLYAYFLLAVIGLTLPYGLHIEGLEIHLTPFIGYALVTPVVLAYGAREILGVASTVLRRYRKSEPTLWISKLGDE